MEEEDNHGHHGKERNREVQALASVADFRCIDRPIT